VCTIRPRNEAPPKQQDWLGRGKAIADEALDRLLDAIDKDPEAVVKGAERAMSSLGRIAVAAGDLRKWAKENPEEAKAKLREAALEGLQQALKARRRKKT
jgi:cell division inhibitor SulA